ncbi:ATP-binding protein [Paraburkholderia sediminicola]|uniref:AlbA family DNA-binding domain-containing protein n=1 Tax=Paraburkholderia sediminicola TaxID=458836 RepID=UPI0038BA4439
MTDEELLARLRDAEDNFVERKPDGVNQEQLRKTLCAFANTLAPDQTGILFIGIHDKTGAVIGVASSDAAQRRVREAAETCYPPIRYTARVLNAEDSAVVAVEVSESDQRPHFTGPAFVRRGSESVNASPEQFDELIASRNDKARAILRMRGLPITLESRGRRLQDDRPAPGAREQTEGRVEHCDAHHVRLNVHAAGLPGWQTAEPLSRVEVSYDRRLARPMLILTP